VVLNKSLDVFLQDNIKKVEKFQSLGKKRGSYTYTCTMVFLSVLV